MNCKLKKVPIGVFDSGYGGLTILRDIRRRLPQYDYLYLGDNARAPYGTRSFEAVYQFTLQAVRYLFGQGCPLVILACNTASAKALRTIQQNDLPVIDPSRRVLGVIRPTVEDVVSQTGHVGVLATPGTVASGSYAIEISHLHPEYTVTAQACPMWVSLVENGEIGDPGTEYYIHREVERLFAADPLIDTVVLACTHFPLLLDSITRHVAGRARIVVQGPIVGDKLASYLQRHTDIERQLTRCGTCTYLTTDAPEAFATAATTFMGQAVTAHHLTLP